jgi:diaminohydroxyphosphoribosylaminopyrimidine deaminase / 5-amino-6-(5-phosphoribosylamino)uracil reductase
MVSEKYMARCLELAIKGAGNVAPNPLVGAVLVYKDTIIGEGYHEQYGKAHAEVNCINNVSEANKKFVAQSTLYVSLEPCAHFGKTPPCCNLIIEKKIPAVVIGCLDSYTEVNGKGIVQLKAAGIDVATGLLESPAKEMNKRFFTFHQLKRPYVILKWAQSKDKKIAQKDFASVPITNPITNRLVHKWRSEEAAIMVGTNTAIYDNPSLTTRLWKGKSPVRIVIDKTLRVSHAAHLLDGEVPTIIFNHLLEKEEGHIVYVKLLASLPMLPQIMEKLFRSFIDQNLWDEARVITNTAMDIVEGINAPLLQKQAPQLLQNIETDALAIYYNTHM